MSGTVEAASSTAVGRPSTSQLAALIAIGRIGARTVLVFRSEVLVGTIALLVRVLLVTLVWRAVYGDRAVVAGVTRDYAVAYAVLGAILGTILNPAQRSNLQTRIRQGRVAIDLLRPVGLIPQTMAQQIGITISAIPRAGLAVVFGVLLGALTMPGAGPLGVIAFVISASAGTAIALLANLIVAMTAFWTTEIGGALMVYTAVAQFASGALIPLWFMPEWLRSGLEWLPFQAQVFVPLSIYFGQTSGWDVAGSIAGQFIWVIGLLVLAEVVWLRAIRRVVILGG